MSYKENVKGMKTMRYFIILLFSANLQAEVIFDGSLGTKLELAGPEYEITEALGTRAGNNLFHSFESFNLSEGEIANFSGSDDIYNVISRVTGGGPSLIDGTIASSMPNAYFYFLNPYGIAFGPNSSLDVQGSFHNSTAHVLRFPDGNDFDAVNPENTLLSVENPSAFGFLSNDIAPIYVQQAKLTIPRFQALSFIGNQPTISNATLLASIAQLYVIGINSAGDVGVKVQSDGTDFTTEFDIQAEQLADVYIQNSGISTAGAKGGNVYIRGGNVLIENSLFVADTGNYNGGVIDIAAQDITLQQTELSTDVRGSGNGGHINLTATNNIALQTGTELHSNARGEGNTGNINLIAGNDIVLQGESQDNNLTFTSLTLQVEEGNGGTMQLQANNIQLTDGAALFASTWESGQGGHIVLNAEENIDISGTTSQGVGSQIGVNSRGEEANAGNGGSIQLNAQSIFISDGAQIGSITTSAGDGGQLAIKSQTLTMTGDAQRIDGKIIPTRLNANATSSGQGGSITIETNELNLQDGAQIAASSLGTGNGGSVSIQTENLTVSGMGQTGIGSSIAANAAGTIDNAGSGGNINITADNITVQDGGQFTSSVLGTGQGGNISIEVAKLALFSGMDETDHASGVLSLTIQGSTGDAGTIRMKSTGLSLANNAQINAQTRGEGLGGNIAIQTEGLVAQRDGRITAQSLGTGDAGSLILDIGNTLVLTKGGAIQTSTEIADGGNVFVDVGKYLFMREGELSTSVGADVGNGGNITLNSQFTVLHDSPIVARAYGGNGGNIDIVTRSLYKMQPVFRSPIDASSRFGLDGVVTISTPDVGSDEGLLVLPNNFMDADVILPKPCSAETLQSSFVLQDKIGITPLQSDWQPAHF